MTQRERRLQRDYPGSVPRENLIVEELETHVLAANRRRINLYVPTVGRTSDSYCYFDAVDGNYGRRFPRKIKLRNLSQVDTTRYALPEGGVESRMVFRITREPQTSEDNPFPEDFPAVGSDKSVNAVHDWHGEIPAPVFEDKKTKHVPPYELGTFGFKYFHKDAPVQPPSTKATAQNYLDKWLRASKKIFPHIPEDILRAVEKENITFVAGAVPSKERDIMFRVYRLDYGLYDEINSHNSLRSMTSKKAKLKTLITEESGPALYLPQRYANRSSKSRGRQLTV